LIGIPKSLENRERIGTGRLRSRLVFSCHLDEPWQFLFLPLGLMPWNRYHADRVAGVALAALPFLLVLTPFPLSLL